MRRSLRLGAGSGFWGDAFDPAVELLERGTLDYLSMDYLAELTMALLQRQRLKDPETGYIPDLPAHLSVLLPLARKSGTRIVCNGGGANPRAAFEAARLKDGRILIRSLEAVGAGFRVAGSGSRGLLGDLAFRGEASVSDLAVVQPGARGVLNATFQARQGGGGRPWSFSADARGQRFATGLAQLDRLLGPTPRLQITADYGDNRLRMERAVLNGAAGDDTLSGGDAADRLFGGAGADSLTVAGGADLMLGGSGDDRIAGGDGNDWLYGEQGCDNLFGGDGIDALFGGSGNWADSLFGGAGDDYLDGGAGNDYLGGDDGKHGVLGFTQTRLVVLPG